MTAWWQGMKQRSRMLAAGMTRRLGLSLALLVVIATGTLAQLAVAGLGMAPAAYAHGVGTTTHGPDTYARFKTTGNAWGAQPGKQGRLPAKTPRYSKTGLPVAKGPSSVGSVMTHPVLVPLDGRLLANASGTPGTNVYWFKSAEGMLEIGIAANSIDLSAALQGAYDVARHTGKLVLSSPYTLVFEQTQGGFFGTSIILGEFTLYVRDNMGNTLKGVRLLAPLSLRLHYAAPDLADVNAASLRLSWASTADVAHHVAAVGVPVTADFTAKTLDASIGELHDGSMILSGAPADENTPTTEHLTMNANQGDLSFTLPLAVPPAAGGVAPPLQLVYSSAGPNGRHASTAPAPWVGDGWDLSLGSITYDSTTSQYYLNGIGGVSEPLICCMKDAQGTNYFVPHHHPNVRVFTTKNDTDPKDNASECFFVRTPDGYEYDLGCSGGSRQTTVYQGSVIGIEWDVNSVGRRGTNTGNGNISNYLQSYTVVYWQDGSSSNGLNYIRDSAPAEIEYDYVNGKALGHIYFNVYWPQATTTNFGATATSYGNNYNCSGEPDGYVTTLRCDDPVQLPPSDGNWEAAPLNMATITLDSVVMKVTYPNASGSPQNVREYDFSYTDSPFVTCSDQFTGEYIACAGEHLLTQVREYPYQMVSGTDTKEYGPQPINFIYTEVTNEYHDATELPNGQPYDAQTHWQYLSQISDEETGFTEAVSWEKAFGNSHGVPSGSADDPTTCDTVNCFANPNADTWPDDRQWPRAAVASITDQGSGSTAGPVTTSYQYTLPTPNCGCTEDYWIPPNGYEACDSQNPPIAPGNSDNACLMGNYSNYYDEEYTGFGTVQTNHPDGSATQDVYYAGEGWGTDDWALGNLWRGKLWTDITFASSANGGAKLVETDHSYSDNTATYCPDVSTYNGQPAQLYINPYMMCELFETQRITYSWNGQTGQPPRLNQTWSYNPYSTPANDPSHGQYYNHFYEQLNSTALSSNDLLWDSYTPSSYGGTNPTFTTTYTDIYRDGETESPQTPYYLLNLPAQTTLTDSSSAGTQWTCTQTSYDGQAFTTGSGNQTGLTGGLATRTDAFSDAVCGSANVVTTGAGYDAYGQPVVTTDADATAGISGHVGCAPGTAPVEVYPTGVNNYSACTTYDATYGTYPTASADALNYATATSYDFLQGVPTQTTDPNSAVTTSTGPQYEYSGGGAPSSSGYLDTYVGTQLPQVPGGTAPWTRRVYTYSFCAAAQAAPGNTTPCYEVDTVQQLDDTANILVARKIYDRDGRLVETRVTGPSAGQDVVTFETYDDLHDKTWQSDPCTVASLTASAGIGAQSQSTANYITPVLNGAGTGTSAYVSPASACPNLAGTATYTDSLGRVVAVDDAMGTGLPANGQAGSGCLLKTTNQSSAANHTTCTVYTVVQGTTLQNGDTEPFVASFTVDGNNHQTAVYKDAKGRVAYTEEFTGTSQTPGSSAFTPYAISFAKYDPMDHARALEVSANGSASGPWTTMSTATYDALGRLTKLVDADLGTYSYTYDPNGNLLSSTDPLGTTVWAGYDGLNRQLWRNTSDTETRAYVTYSYDSTANGNPGRGRLTSESFDNGANASLPMSGEYDYTYDLRGQVTSLVQGAKSGVYNGSYTLNFAYDDAGLPTSLQYPDNELVSLNYGATGWLSAVSTQPSGGSTTNLLTNIGYTADEGGLSGQINSASVGNTTYSYSASYDADLRLTSTSMALAGGGATQFSSARTYDGAGNVTAVNTVLPAGTDNQVFCYDEQNRLVWAGSTGTPPATCNGGTGPTLSPGTLTSAYYTQSFSYDAFNRLITGPLGNYTYGNAAHQDAVTSIQETGSPSYTASYDADGSMTCRAPTSSVTCTGSTPSGQVLTYDAERRLASWASGPGVSPAHEAQDLYDGEGNRVEQVVQAYTCTRLTCGEQTQSDTLYLASGAEELTTAEPSGTLTTTKYYSAGGLLLGVSVNGTISYLASDGLGSVSAALSTGGSETAVQLYAPYGGVRSSSGTMPTARGYTGQYADSLTGLAYYGARYYDPVAGQFTSADSVQGPNRYGYVAGNPTTATDPSGHLYEDADRGLNGNSGRAGEFGDGSDGGNGSGDATAPGPTVLTSEDGLSETVSYPDGEVVRITMDASGDVTSETIDDETTGDETSVDATELAQEGEVSEEANAVHADEGEQAQARAVDEAENTRTGNTKPNGGKPGGGAVVTQDGATPLKGYSGEQGVKNPGFNTDNHPYNGGCAEVSCASKAVTAIQNGEGGWEVGKPATMSISQANGLSPCEGCDDVLYQLASYLDAPVTAVWQDDEYGITSFPYPPGVVPFGR